MDFADIAEQARMSAGEAKSVLLSAINSKTKASLQSRLEAQEPADSAFLSVEERLEKVDYQQVLALLK